MHSHTETAYCNHVILTTKSATRDANIFLILLCIQCCKLKGMAVAKKKQSSTQQPSLLSGSTEASSSSSIPSGSHCKIKAASAFSLISGMLPATNMYMSCNGHKAQGDVLHLWTRLDRLDSTTSTRWLAFTRSQIPMNRKLDFLLGLHVQAPAKQVQMLLVSVRNDFTL